jgi:hypothetical protein
MKKFNNIEFNNLPENNKIQRVYLTKSPPKSAYSHFGASRTKGKCHEEKNKIM